MKKAFLILVILTMVCSMFAKGSSEKQEKGTYIPFAMYETVETTKSYSEGIALTSSKEYYTVLCVTENKILSDLKFHDAFQLSKDEIDFSFSSKNGKRFLTDNNTGIEYIKISDTTDYNAAYNDFLLQTVMKSLAKENPNISIKNSIIIFDDKEWKIDKDQWHYSEGLQIILYFDSSKEYVGFVDNKAYSLKNGDDLKKVVDKEIL